MECLALLGGVRIHPLEKQHLPYVKCAEEALHRNGAQRPNQLAFFGQKGPLHVTCCPTLSAWILTTDHVYGCKLGLTGSPKLNGRTPLPSKKLTSGTSKPRLEHLMNTMPSLLHWETSIAECHENRGATSRWPIENRGRSCSQFSSRAWQFRMFTASSLSLSLCGALLEPFPSQLPRPETKGGVSTGLQHVHGVLSVCRCEAEADVRWIWTPLWGSSGERARC